MFWAFRLSADFFAGRYHQFIVESIFIEQLGKNFNPEAADFNLEGVFSLGLHNLAEFIGDLSTNANKELGIEQVHKKTRYCVCRIVVRQFRQIMTELRFPRSASISERVGRLKAEIITTKEGRP